MDVKSAAAERCHGGHRRLNSVAPRGGHELERASGGQLRFRHGAFLATTDRPKSSVAVVQGVGGWELISVGIARQGRASSSAAHEKSRPEGRLAHRWRRRSAPLTRFGSIIIGIGGRVRSGSIGAGDVGGVV